MAATAEREGKQARGVRPLRAVPEGPVERLCNFACMVALVVMLGVIGVDVVTRALLNFSFEVSDELGGYMLVVITFVSLPVCQVNGSLIWFSISCRWRSASLCCGSLSDSRCRHGGSTITLRPIWRRRSGSRG